MADCPFEPRLQMASRKIINPAKDNDADKFDKKFPNHFVCSTFSTFCGLKCYISYRIKSIGQQFSRFFVFVFCLKVLSQGDHIFEKLNSLSFP